MNRIISKCPPLLNGINQPILVEYFINSWNLNELLFSSIKNEQAYYSYPEKLRHPLIFYYGHTAVFYMNKLRMAGLLKEGIHPFYEKLFAEGVDPQLPSELKKMDWPSISAMRLYRQQVYETILNVIQKTDIPSCLDEASPLWALLMSMEHDRIHFETSSMIIRQLPVNDLQKPDVWQYAPTESLSSQIKLGDLIDIPSQTVTLGKKNPSIFGWDNEYGHLEIDVPQFQAGRYLVTNTEYKHFVEDGGYLNKDYWNTEGWAWKKLWNVQSPRFWRHREDGIYDYRAMFDEFALPKDWPVEVNFYEAQAYCKWLGTDHRLMTEAEHNAIITLQDRLDDELHYELYNINFKYGSPCNVGALSEQASQFRIVDDIRGNVWQWLSNDFYPLPGFQPHPYYQNFSLPFFGQEHAMLAGGAWITTGTGASTNYRGWFRRNFYQHAGFRVCRG